MVDSIQSRSSLPIPAFQTELGSRDPATVSSPRDLQRVDTAAAEKKADTSKDSFADYLNQSSITTIGKSNGSNFADAAADIAANSVYAQPGRPFV